MVRKVDKTKKSNIKCEHCDNWKNHEFCGITKEKKNYWNRCRQFVWRKDIQ